MQSKATSVEQYLAELPADRRDAIERIRSVILKNLSKGFEEGMQYGMIGYFVPHSVYPAGYHCDPKQPLPFAAVASQKNHMAIYMMSINGHPEHEAWFRAAWSKTGKKLDMGKSCIRFKKIDDVPLEVIGEAVKRVPATSFIEHYEAMIRATGRRADKHGAQKASGSAGKQAPKSTSKADGKAARRRG